MWLAFAGTLNLLTHFTESLHNLSLYFFHPSHLHVRQLLLLLLLLRLTLKEPTIHINYYITLETLETPVSGKT
jgi:hypothetical protein